MRYSLCGVSRITPEDLPPTEVDTFLAPLFEDAPLLAAGTDDRIRGFVGDVFDQLTEDVAPTPTGRRPCSGSCSAWSPRGAGRPAALGR
ncbi:MAG: hypothetical protein ACRC8U_00450 [Brooklawnia sp.]